MVVVAVVVVVVRQKSLLLVMYPTTGTEENGSPRFGTPEGQRIDTIEQLLNRICNVRLYTGREHHGRYLFFCVCFLWVLDDIALPFMWLDVIHESHIDDLAS